jgi:hypothetical protein
MAKVRNTPNELIRVSDQEAREMLSKLATADMRPAGTEVGWLIRQEFARRFSTPQPLVTIAEALKA